MQKKIEKTCKPCGLNTFCNSIKKDGEVVASWYSGSAVPFDDTLFWTSILDLTEDQARILSEEELADFI
jgi:hypothetical protein